MFEFITEMSAADMIVIGLLWVLSVVVSTVLMWTFVIPKFLRNIILDMISTPSPKTIAAVQSLAAMIISTKVQTGKKIRDEDGIETDEEVPMLVYAGREIFAAINHKMNAAKGGAKAQAQAILEGAVAQSGGDVRALLPMALNAAARGDYGPLLMVISTYLINKPQDNTGTQQQGGSGSSNSGSNLRKM